MSVKIFLMLLEKYNLISDFQDYGLTERVHLKVTALVLGDPFDL